jgi:tetratricopeptide (TPR) repeat protein
MVLGQALAALGREAEARVEFERHERVLLMDKIGLLDGSSPGLDWPEWKRAAILARHHFAAGREADGMKELALSYELAPENPEALVVEADHWLEAERDEHRARELLERALRSDPESVHALRLLSILLSTATDASLRDAPRALELARAALAHERGDDVGGLLALGLAEAARGEQAAARAALQRVLELAPESERAALELARLEER